MRLSRLDLTRFGKFTDHVLDFGVAAPGSPDLHIVYGLNEAGKSTTFAAYLDLLYGIEEKKDYYNFLHSYPTMEIGAALEIDGAIHDFRRFKRRKNSLLDGHGQPANEALITTALNGVTRDGYRTMFSLDDASLKEGGNAIIESRGELGQMLFSASSGLAGISRALEEAEQKAGEIHRKRASSTRMAALRNRLKDLKADRDALDTAASAYAALKSTYEQADQAYRRENSELAELQARHGAIGRLLSALPAMRRHETAKGELDAMGDPPRPPAEWFARLPILQQQETRLDTLDRELRQALAQLDADLAAIETDDAILETAARIEAVLREQDRFTTAEDDLPKRRLAAREQEVLLRSALAELGQVGHPEPAALVLPASLIGTIRTLIEQKSGIDARLEGGEREVRRAEDLLARHEAMARENGQGAVPDADLVARIDAALARFSGADLVAKHKLAERDCRRAEMEVRDRLDRLDPWQGDADSLRRLPLPDLRDLEGLRAKLADREQRIATLKERIGEREAEIAGLTGRIAALDRDGDLSDTAARESREARNAAWRAHRAELSAATADRFEERLFHDDGLSERRMSAMQNLAALRQSETKRAELAPALAHDKAQLEGAQADLSALADEIRALLPQGFEPAQPLPRLLGLLEAFLRNREAALLADERLRAVLGDRDDLGREISSHRQELARLADLAGIEVEDEAAIEELVGQLADLRDRARASEGRLRDQARLKADLERDLAERRRDGADAVAAYETWIKAWDDVLAKTWFGKSGHDVAAVREILGVLASLPAILREREQVEQRIAAMERDQTHFDGEITALLDSLGMARGRNALDGAERLRARLIAARDAARKPAELSEARERQLRKIADHEDELAAHQSEKASLSAFFGQDTLSTMAVELSRFQERDQRRKALRELEADIADMLQVTDFADAVARLSEVDTGELERQSNELGQQIADLTTRKEQLYAESVRSRDALDAVGGDDRVARIEAERRTVLVEIEDLAQTYLRLRAGAMAADRALFLYREQHRSAMMERASNAFRLITGGNYSGLAVQPDQNREILIGVGGAGGSKRAADMSTGTQFQLYLALRLAGYQEIAQVRDPVPFIADDIMESFDNPRSKEVFRLLGEMAHTGQVIYLTHHWHLCEIAREVVSGVRIHELP